MIKNVRCVSSPNSGGLVGIEAAVVLGAFGGDCRRGMEVLEAVTPQARAEATAFLQQKAYEAFTGILKEEAEETIRCVGYIGKIGIREIVKMMLN